MRLNPPQRCWYGNIIVRVNLDRDEPLSEFVLCRNCRKKLFLYATRLIKYVEKPDAKGFATGDIAVAIQIKCTKCKSYNSITFRDEPIARPPKVDDHESKYTGRAS